MKLFTKESIGVEIDDLEIRVVGIKQSWGRVSLAFTHRAPLTENLIIDGVIHDPEGVANVIENLWDKHKLSNMGIIIGVSNQAVMARKILLPDIPEDKLKLLIHNHAQEYMPISLENSVMDYMIVGKEQVQDVANVQVLLVVAQLKMVEDFFESFNRASLKPKDIKPSSLSTPDALKIVDKDVVMALVDISNSIGNLTIFVDGQPRFSRLLRVNFNKSTGLDPSKNSSIMELPPIILSTWSQILDNEIRASIRYFQEQEDINSIDSIKLSGCGSRVKGLAKELENSLDIPVDLVDPLGRIQNSKRQANDESVIDFTTCIGLALAGLE
ncbi:MAG TPA: pilus assembly protein PilM [Clostridia bacterium]|nr:pilus assembly protein PilM [Clostridia bacterium]